METICFGPYFREKLALQLILCITPTEVRFQTLFVTCLTPVAQHSVAPSQ